MSANGDAVGVENGGGKVGGGGGGEAAAVHQKKKKLINVNLISLKCLLFFFFGGIGCLVPFLPLHMLTVGLNDQEIRTISMICPVVALIGPLVAGPIADRVAASRLRRQKANAAAHNNQHPPSSQQHQQQQQQQQGMYLRVMIAVCCVFSALFYGLLLLVPVVERIDVPHELRPAVRFSCDEQGATVHQERCRDDAFGCHRWSNEDRVGGLRLRSCAYACYDYPTTKRRRDRFPPQQAPTLSSGSTARQQQQPSTTLSSDRDDGRLLPSVIPLGEMSATTPSGKNYGMVLPKSPAPHVCYSDLLGRRICHVFTEQSEELLLNVSLRQASNPEDSDSWCAFPTSSGALDCRVPRELKRANRSCQIECQLEDPYGDYSLGVGSNVLAESQCRRVKGNAQLTFWMYLAIRCLADVFPTAALALIDAAVVIATRETSAGRGDVGRQLAFGALGIAAFGPLGGYLTTQLGPAPGYYAPLLLHAALVLLAAFVALSAHAMPLSPPEWWWHTRSGLLALPMSAVRKYGGESAALFLVLVIAGALWSALDSYLPLHLARLHGDELSIGLALTLGALPAVIFLWKSEHFVDYCGHSNLLITAFIMYIARFTSLSVVPDAWWALIPGALEVFTLEIMWITTIVYFRHLIPRQMTATGQALPVIAHFCIGRAIGAVIGACVDKIDRDNDVDAMRYIYQCLAVAAAGIAILYFVLYHGIFKPRCHARMTQGSHIQTSTILQEMNGKQNYSPLRVYHNGMGRKGQFRY